MVAAALGCSELAHGRIRRIRDGPAEGPVPGARTRPAPGAARAAQHGAGSPAFALSAGCGFVLVPTVIKVHPVAKPCPENKAAG